MPGPDIAYRIVHRQICEIRIDLIKKKKRKNVKISSITNRTLSAGNVRFPAQFRIRSRPIFADEKQNSLICGIGVAVQMFNQLSWQAKRVEFIPHTLRFLFRRANPYCKLDSRTARARYVYLILASSDLSLKRDLGGRPE